MKSGCKKSAGQEGELDDNCGGEAELKDGPNLKIGKS